MKRMGLIERIFKPPRDKEAAASGMPAASAFAEGDGAPEEATGRGAPRRELVQVVMRDTMRSHGIPSDWLDCRILAGTSRRGPGLHVHFVVRKAHDQMLPYVLAFQHSFVAGLLEFDARAHDWLLGLAWQFEGAAPPQRPETPPAGRRSDAAVPPAHAAHLAATARNPAAVAAASAEEDLHEDLQALFAIRDQALAQNAGKRSDDDAADSGYEPTRPTDLDGR